MKAAWRARIYALILGMIALLLIVSGSWLAALGGSVYYLLAGLALLAVAVLTWRLRQEAMWLYAAIVAATICWSIWEVGLSAWALMPRVVAWLVVGSWMLTPRFRRMLRPTTQRFAAMARYTGWSGLAASLIAAVALGMLLHSFQSEAPDPRFRAGVSLFPDGRRMAGATVAGEWRHWGGDAGGSRFSTLTQITPANVGKLELAWSSTISWSDAGLQAGLQVTPLMVGDTLYTCSNANEVAALDAETGAVRWHVDTAGTRGRTCRGVAHYAVPGATGPCAERIITATGAASLIALDARSGRRCASFGKDGSVDLLRGLTHAPRGYYRVSSAPVVTRGKIIIGGSIHDGQYWGEPSGVIRAYDAVTGELAWAWDMGHPDRVGEPPAGETYTPATPNSWAPISFDEQLGLVYLPIGNATPDYFGAQRRPFDDRYSSSVVALDSETGRERWSFQTVHHDVWDYDVASQPSLVDLPGPKGEMLPALVQATKRGETFVLDRRTGKPIRGVFERPVPQAGKVPEERLSRTQPFSALPSFAGPDMRETDMWGITPLDQAYCRIKFRQARYEGTMTPPGTTPWISFPGNVGGSNWGSVSIDADHGVMIVPTTKLATYNRLIPRAEARKRHIKPMGDDAKLVELAAPMAQEGTPYASVNDAFLSPLGVPCQAPPYGQISAVDLVTGKLIWSRPLGTARDTGPFGMRTRLPLPLGTATSGGALTTRAGLVFIGAAQDRTFRALDVRTGRQLWQIYMPQGAFSTPMTYVSRRSGRQFIVVAAGGMPLMDKSKGARLLAYALPR